MKRSIKMLAVRQVKMKRGVGRMKCQRCGKRRWLCTVGLEAICDKCHRQPYGH